MSALERLAREAAALLREKPPIVGVEGNLLVVGDTHGYPEVSRWALKLAERLNSRHIIFLGDYVDRGPQGVENLELLLTLLLDDPNYIIMLRGNHESPTMNYYYGFRDEVVNKLGYEALKSIEELYECLPIAATAKGVVMLHGGVPCRLCTGEPEDPPALSEIGRRAERIHCKREALEPSDPIVFQVLWNDPRSDLEWFAPNIRGPGIYYYGWRVWQKFLQKTGAKLLVRAHEVVDGIRVMWRGRVEEGVEGSFELETFENAVITVFSSLYHGMRAGALYLEENRVTFYFYPSLP